MTVNFGWPSFRRDGFPSIAHPAPLMLLAAVFLLSGCGFHLRGDAKLPFKSVYVQSPPTSQFSIKLKRAISSGSKTKVTDNPTTAQVTLYIFGERQQKVILSLSSAGLVSEFRLLYQVSYRLTDSKGLELIPTSTIALQRDFSFSDSAVLSKESEEALLYRDMQSDAVQQLVRRLEAAHIDVKS